MTSRSCEQNQRLWRSQVLTSPSRLRQRATTTSPDQSGPTRCTPMMHLLFRLRRLVICPAFAEDRFTSIIDERVGRIAHDLAAWANDTAKFNPVGPGSAINQHKIVLFGADIVIARSAEHGAVVADDAIVAIAADNQIFSTLA